MKMKAQITATPSTCCLLHSMSKTVKIQNLRSFAKALIETKEAEIQQLKREISVLERNLEMRRARMRLADQRKDDSTSSCSIGGYADTGEILKAWFSYYLYTLF